MQTVFSRMFEAWRRARGRAQQTAPPPFVQPTQAAVRQGPPPQGPPAGTRASVSVYGLADAPAADILTGLTRIGFTGLEVRAGRWQTRVTGHAVLPVTGIDERTVEAAVVEAVAPFVPEKVDAQVWPYYR